jgi:hypothetical protein
MDSFINERVSVLMAIEVIWLPPISTPIENLEGIIG